MVSHEWLTKYWAVWSTLFLVTLLIWNLSMLLNLLKYLWFVICFQVSVCSAFFSDYWALFETQGIDRNHSKIKVSVTVLFDGCYHRQVCVWHTCTNTSTAWFGEWTEEDFTEEVTLELRPEGWVSLPGRQN